MKTIAIIGLGNRGGVYAKYLAKNEKVKIVSVCDILPESLRKAHDEYGVAQENLFLNEGEFFSKKRADVLIVSTLDKQHYEQTIKAVPMGKFADPEKDVGGVCVFLCSDAASYVTGETITLQGGSGLRP